MGWKGSLQLAYHRDMHGRSGPTRETAAPRTVLHSRHDGPLRVLTSLYPEGPGVCHNVLVHPPGGLVGGDELDIDVDLQDAAHALITTPGATRFYRSTGASATQRLHVRVAEGARLEWLPLESIAFSGCLARNQMRFDLAPGAEMIGWDVLALGLPASSQPFVRGSFAQSIELPGRWLERGTVAASDTLLLDSPLGWAGHRVMATLWIAAGSAMPAAQREALLDSARTIARGDPLERSAGCTAVNDGVVVLRTLAPRVEPAMALLTRIWAAWREQAWGLPPCVPRVWRT